MLGREQERWLADGFARSRAQWNIVGQQLLIAELEHLPYEDERYCAPSRGASCSAIMGPACRVRRVVRFGATFAA